MTLISVIVPIFNSSDYLRQALSSLEEQEFKEAEFICIDDGSSDDSFEICKEYAARDTRFIVLSQENRGPSGTRNNGLSIATGKYICFMDSDDYLVPGALSILYERAEEGNYDIVVHGAYVFGDSVENTPEWINKAISTRNRSYKKFTVKELFTENGCRPFLWQHFIKSDLIKNNNLRFNEKLKIGEDQAFEILYFSYAKKVLFIGDKLYGYRIYRRGSIMYVYEGKFKEKIWQHIELIRNVQNEKRDISSDEEIYFIKWALDLIYWDFLKLLYSEQAEYAFALMQIFVQWNIHKHVNEISISDYVMYRHIEIVGLYNDSPDILLSELKKVQSAMDGRLVKIKNNFFYKSYRKYLDKIKG
jgi:glycosyltransferase involved in cell wall biosynthesis